ncbi:hypothetical protein FACS1894132_03730 [Clostridia bacterium]|nr:hypothetical protein FACS1894132_03730 [Clostridia bacterium]
MVNMFHNNVLTSVNNQDFKNLLLGKRGHTKKTNTNALPVDINDVLEAIYLIYREEPKAKIHVIFLAQLKEFLQSNDTFENYIAAEYTISQLSKERFRKAPFILDETFLKFTRGQMFKNRLKLQNYKEYSGKYQTNGVWESLKSFCDNCLPPDRSIF